MEKLTFDVILGMYFLRDHRVIIDAEQSEIYYKFPSPFFNVKTIENVIIPAYSNMLVDVSILEALPSCHVINSHPEMVKHGIFVAQGLIDVSRSNFNILRCCLLDPKRKLSNR